MAVETISYQAGGKTFIGALVYDERVSAKRPLLLWRRIGSASHPKPSRARR